TLAELLLPIEVSHHSLEHRRRVTIETGKNEVEQTRVNRTRDRRVEVLAATEVSEQEIVFQAFHGLQRRCQAQRVVMLVVPVRPAQVAHEAVLPRRLSRNPHTENTRHDRHVHRTRELMEVVIAYAALCKA